jgi:hypothetical protein
VPTREPSRFALVLGAKSLTAFAVGGLLKAANRVNADHPKLENNV